jgi:hypothetical protein
VTRRYPLLAVASCLLATASIAQNPQPYAVPVTCSTAHDRISPTPPDAVKNSLPKAEALEIEKEGRKHSGFLSMPEPENLGVEHYGISEYATCKDSAHCYWRDLQTQLDKASAELKRLVGTRKPGEKLAMVLDIDETSLSNYCEQSREGFGFVGSVYNAYLMSTDASIPIPGTLALFNQARVADVDVYFITGRNNDQTKTTARNLRIAGYDKWSGLTLRNDHERNMDTTLYKSNERAKIAQDHRIILNVGDQWSDLNGPNGGEVSVKLPNPFYFIP